MMQKLKYRHVIYKLEKITTKLNQNNILRKDGIQQLIKITIKNIKMMKIMLIN